MTSVGLAARFEQGPFHGFPLGLRVEQTGVCVRQPGVDRMFLGNYLDKLSEPYLPHGVPGAGKAILM